MVETREPQENQIELGLHNSVSEYSARRYPKPWPRKLLSCAQDAERHRHRIYGGAELTETANLLQSICQMLGFN